MVVPVSRYPLEYTLVTPILSAPSGSPIGFIVDGESRALIGENGARQVLTKNSIWSPLSATSGEAHTLYIVSSSIREGSRVYTNEIHVSNRTLQPNRWRTYCHDDSQEEPIYDRFWLRRGGGDVFDPATGQGTSQTGVGPPIGGATDLNERWWERFNQNPTVTSVPEIMQFHHNPTFGGSGDRPTIGTDMAVSAKGYTSKPYVFYTRSRESSSVPALIIGGGVPLDFGGDPGNYEFSDHGYGIGNDAEDQPAWWWRMRMWRKFFPAYNEMPRITRVDSGSYFPVNWVSSPGDRVLAQLVESYDLVPSAFSECYFLNVSSGAMTRLPNVYTTGTFVTGIAAQYAPGTFTAANIYASQHGIMRHRITQRFDATLEYSGQPLRVVPAMPAYNSPYLGLIWRDPSSGFAFSVATRVEPCTDLNQDSRNDSKHTCSLQAWHRLAKTTRPYTELANEGDNAFIVHKSDVERGQGWIFQKTFVFIGEFSSVSGDFRSLFEAGEFDIPVTEADVPQEILDSLDGESYSVSKANDRGQLHPFVATLHDIGEKSKLLQASGYHHYYDPSSYAKDFKWKNVNQSLANVLTEDNGYFPNSFEDYTNFELGRDFHKLYYDYTHNFNAHRTSPMVTIQDGPTVVSHALGSLLYNSDFSKRGSVALSGNLITTNIANTVELRNREGIFSSSGTASGTYIANSILDVGQRDAEYRNSGILQHIELCQVSGTSNNNSFSVFDIDSSFKTLITKNPLLDNNILIKQSAFDGFGRIIFDISKYSLDPTLYDITTNFLSPNHDFNLKFKTAISDSEGLSLGGGTVGVWIHTKPELDKVWSFTKNGEWVQHSASAITIPEVLEHSHLFNLGRVTREITSSGCVSFLDVNNPNRKNQVVASLTDADFHDISIDFHTRNHTCLDIPNTIVTPEYFDKVSNNVHRVNQNYVIEIFTIPTQDDKFTLYYDMSMIDLTLNRWSKPLVNKIPEPVDLYFLIGDSIANGANGIASQLTQFSEYSSVRNSVPGCYIYRGLESVTTTGIFGPWDSPRFELFSPGKNLLPESKIAGIDQGLNYGADMGPEVSLFHNLRQKSKNRDIYVIKLTRGGTHAFLAPLTPIATPAIPSWLPVEDWSVSSTGEMFDKFKTWTTDAVSILRKQNKYINFKGGVIIAGTNLPPYYANESLLSATINTEVSSLYYGILDLMSDLSVDTTNSKITWSIPSLPVGTGLVWAPNNNYMRNAMSALNSVDPRFTYFELSSFDAYRNDNVHFNTTGHILLGESLVNTFIESSAGSVRNTDCKEFRVDLTKEQILHILRYFNQIRGEYSTVGYTGINNLTGYASREASTTQGFYEASGGSRINYTESPLWNTVSLNTSSLIENITIIN